MLEEAHKLTSSREILLWMTPSEAPKALQASECNELLDPKLPKGDPPPPADPSVGILPRGPTPLLCTLVHGLHYRMYTLQGWHNCRETVLAGEQACDNLEGGVARVWS